MFNNYFLTPLESVVEDLYKEKGILTPEDLKMENVAKMFDVQLIFVNEGVEEAIWEDDKIAIFIKHAPLPVMRSVFFHELSHPLFHVGNQLHLSSSFKELQEYQAGHFEAYASMPFFMIRQLEIPALYDEFVDLIANTFVVTYYQAKMRVDQIRRRNYQVTSDNRIINLKSNKYRPHKPRAWTTETNRIMNQLYEQIGEKQ